MVRLVAGPVVLVVLDGWGLREEKAHNGIALANTPWYDTLVHTYPFTRLEASGLAVGLPASQMGNSEVGHTTIGAGCVLYQDLVRISKDVESGQMGKNKSFLEAVAHVKSRDSSLHIIGLLSAGGVHAHETHFKELIRSAKAHGVKSIILHPFLDGRDCPKTAGTTSLRELEALIRQFEGVKIGSVTGRYYAMDRDNNLERTMMAFSAIFDGNAQRVFDASVSPSAIILEHYHNDIFDEMMPPMVFKTEDGKTLQVNDGDAIVFSNFRNDRAKQLALQICTKVQDKDLIFVTMTKYGEEVKSQVMYESENIVTTLGKVIADANLVQTHIAETEKFPHATYFLNGGQQTPYPKEEDVVIPSRKDVPTHDLAPQMRAKEICDAALTRLAKTDFMFINFANPDMVGHTANEPAIITAIEFVDLQLKRLTQAVLERNGALVVIADHGNAEVMVDPDTGAPHTSHTSNPVPFIFVHKHMRPALRTGSLGLRDVAPTVLSLLGLATPPAMTGRSILDLHL